MHQSNKRLIVVAGPTAVGKTKFAIQLAQHFKTEIVSADSRQIYKELSIGVARPSEEELNSVEHHFIASHSIQNDYNAGLFERESNDTIAKLYTKHNTVVMCGGTGLYIKAATQGLDDLPIRDEDLRAELNALFQSEGMEGLLQKLDELKIDKSSVETSNPQRVIRAIEIHSKSKSTSQQKSVSRDYSCSYYYLNMERQKLYERINLRVDQMIQNGLIEEAKKLYPHKNLNGLTNGWIQRIICSVRWRIQFGFCYPENQAAYKKLCQKAVNVV